VNAHPHTDCSGDFVVVHNGIIENYLALKEALIEKGHVFKSETDTEVVAHLLEEVYNGDFEESVREVLRRIEGSYSLVFMCRQQPGPPHLHEAGQSARHWTRQRRELHRVGHPRHHQQDAPHVHPQ
jgi:hypothetical protein